MEHSLRYQKCGNEQFNSESLFESLFFTRLQPTIIIVTNDCHNYAESVALRRVSSGNMEMF